MENNNQNAWINNGNDRTKLDPAAQNRYTFYSISYIFMIITTVIMGFLIIPLLWMIPMTLMNKRFMDEVGTNRETPHIAFGICALLFTIGLGIVSGILILIASVSVGPAYPRQNA